MCLPITQKWYEDSHGFNLKDDKCILDENNDLHVFEREQKSSQVINFQISFEFCEHSPWNEDDSIFFLKQLFSDLTDFDSDF